MLLIVVSFCSSCAGQESELQKIKVPIWSKDALMEEYRQPIITGSHIIMKGQPSFYKGAMPLSCTIGQKHFPFDIVNKPITLYLDFGEFKNSFIYDKLTMINGGPAVAEGACTTDVSGRLLAEARLVRITEDGIEIEEFHYSPDGKLIFRCKSIMDYLTGFKEKETNVIGDKSGEYYFIWPSK